MRLPDNIFRCGEFRDHQYVVNHGMSSNDVETSEVKQCLQGMIGESIRVGVLEYALARYGAFAHFIILDIRTKHRSV